MKVVLIILISQSYTSYFPQRVTYVVAWVAALLKKGDQPLIDSLYTESWCLDNGGHISSDDIRTINDKCVCPGSEVKAITSHPSVHKKHDKGGVTMPLKSWLLPTLTSSS